MPVVKLYISNLRGSEDAYVSGKAVSRWDKRALRRGHPHVSRWEHDTMFPHKGHLLWIMPLHALLAGMIYLAITIHSAFSLAATPFGIGAALFWSHIHMNNRARRLRRERMIAYSYTEHWHSILSGIVEFHWPQENRPKDFHEWLTSQLKATAPYFGRIQPIVDEYLHATRYARQLQAKRLSYADISDKLGEAGDTAFALLLPIYNEAKAEEKRVKEEHDERLARETEFQENEEKRLTAQRVSIAVDDLDRYVLGHNALAPTQLEV